MKRLLLTILCLTASICQVLHATTREDVATDIATLSKLLYHLNANYVDTVDVDALTEVAIKAVLGELDPHSTYMTPSEMKTFKESLNGGFEGIGVSFRMVHDTIMVMRAIEGGPSEKAGIGAGDLIVSCDDKNLAGCKLSNDDIKNTLRGPEGSTARLGIIPSGKDKALTYVNVRRGKIPVYSAETYYMVTDKIGYISIDRFAMTTAQEVDHIMDLLKAEGMEDLIIDLQNNGGGYLNAAVELASLFLPPLQRVVYTKGRSDEQHDYNTSLFSSHFKGRVVVLIDEQSASASEIFAGCMQDYDRGVIVGRRSFGKGLVQRPVELPNGGLARITVSHYYTPSGRCIQKPYTKGNKKDYQEDLINRLHSGELLSADSIHLADSLKYYTRAGRVVYGGGGIMPDIFVPLDTTRITPAHRAVSAKGSVNDFAVNYFRHHYHDIHTRYPSLDAFLDTTTGFRVDDELMRGVIEQARQDSVVAEGLDSLVYNDYFRTQVLAYLANNLYDNSAYRRVVNNVSHIYLRAIELLADDRKYRQYLQP